VSRKKWKEKKRKEKKYSTNLVGLHEFLQQAFFLKKDPQKILPF
jgi:hypothetical protein